MMEFDILSRVQKIGDRKGATVYYARLKSQAKMDNDMVIERIVRETSLSEGDVKNALVSLSNVVCDALKMGMSVDLAELGNFRLNVSSKMMNSPEEVTVKDALNTPKIVFTPKQKMRDAANEVELSVERDSVKASAGGGSATTPPDDEEQGRQARGYRLSSMRLMTTWADISLLAASGMTRLRGPSITSSVTMRPRRTGRQCMK